MNIFLLSHATQPAKHFAEQAAFHCDKHVVKMIAESVQLIVTALHARSYPEFGTYLPSSIVDLLPCRPLATGMAKHPCAIWAATSASHINYLCNLALALCHEKARRWPLNADHEYQLWLRDLQAYLSSLGYGPAAPLPTHFPIAVMSDELRSTSTPHQQVVDIYRNYYVSHKQRFATWKKTIKPLWWILATEQAN